MTGHKRLIQQTESQVDVTDRIECYENGKVFECDCGQDHGVTLNCRATKCPRCNKTCIDRRADDREPPETLSGQSTLGDW